MEAGPCPHPEHPPGPAEVVPLGEEDPREMSSPGSGRRLLRASEGQGISTKVVPDLFQEFRVR